jgi:hypothetical protein
LKHNNVSCCVLSGLLALAALNASGQDVPAPVTGTVLDAAQAGVAAATVRFLQEIGVPVANVAADSTGSFRFNRVPPGSYKIMVERDGFEPSVVHLKVGRQSPSPLVVHLEIATVRSELNVSDQATELNTNTADNHDSLTLNRQALDNLPMFDQDSLGTTLRFRDSGSIPTGGATIIGVLISVLRQCGYGSAGSAASSLLSVYVLTSLLNDAAKDLAPGGRTT